ncbi:hypothetical protein EVAR_40203_1 [Eumeta japonica]|uniref:Uncharacterized protein n=1 Tax=Eumeta variegata TaxID=151549 RepID=A0A4C1XLS0_EUMVA|nr:hypothetical protein EVAR_40203_1 [Eumeta japonica]
MIVYLLKCYIKKIKYFPPCLGEHLKLSVLGCHHRTGGGGRQQPPNLGGRAGGQSPNPSRLSRLWKGVRWKNGIIKKEADGMSDFKARCGQRPPLLLRSKVRMPLSDGMATVDHASNNQKSNFN